jgi:D-inositol-3-phosphate glycosyltransferase
MEEPGEGLAGGMNVFLRGLLKSLGEAGVPTDVLTRATGETVEVTTPFPEVRIFHVPCFWPSAPTRRGAWESLDVFTEKARLLLRGEGVSPRVVSAHYWMSGVASRRLFEAPMILSYHTVEERKTPPRREEDASLSDARRAAEAGLAREASRVVCFTEYDLEENRRVFPELSGKGVVIPPGVDPRFRRLLPREVSRSYLGLPQAPVIFLLAAREDAGKNAQSALDAYRSLREREGGETLLLVAGRNAPPGISGERVVCLGSVPHDSMPVVYAAADATLCPSLYESFGLVALESLSAAVPVLVPEGTYWGGKVRAEGGGLAYPPDDPEGLFRAMRALYRDASLRARLSFAGPKVAEQFTWERCTQTWKGLLSSVSTYDNPR